MVSTANYKAREYGIHSALPISQAWKLSEKARERGLEPALFLSVDFKKYRTISKRIMAILGRHASIVEPASIDEAYFDLTFTGSYEEAEKAARRIKEEIRTNEGLTASVGIGPNKLIAKIASDRQKPDGLTTVREEEAEQFLAPPAGTEDPRYRPEERGKIRPPPRKDRVRPQEALRRRASGAHGKMGGPTSSGKPGARTTPLSGNLTRPNPSASRIPSSTTPLT